MRRFVFGLVLLAGSVVVPSVGRAGSAPSADAPGFAVSDSVVDRLAGAYRADDDRATLVTIRSLGGGQAHIAGEGWEALGWFGTREFDGVWRRPGIGSDRSRPHEVGLLHLSVGPGSIAASFWGAGGKGAVRAERWTFAGPPGSEPADVQVKAPAGGAPDASRELAVPDTMPEPILRVPPVYPQIAHDSGIEGTVMVQVLVGKDGWVKDARVVHSVAGLTDAAIECAKRWHFSPAKAKGKPVATWTVLPIEFKLH